MPIFTLLPSQTDALLDSVEAFDAYLTTIHERRAVFLLQKEERCRLQNAIERLEEEHCLTCEVGYVALAGELQTVLTEVRRRLESLDAGIIKTEVLSSTETILPSIILPLESEPFAVVAVRLPKVETLEPPSVKPITVNNFDEKFDAKVLPSPSVSLPVLTEAVTLKATPTAPEPDVLEIEKQALISRFQENLSVLKSTNRAFLEGEFYREDGNLARGMAFGVRQRLCQLESLRCEIKTHKLNDHFKKELEVAENQLLTPWFSVHSSQLNVELFRDRYTSDFVPMTADDWNWLAEAYGWVQKAQEAWEWLIAHDANLSNDAICTLMEQIAATQQILYRRLVELDGNDKLQVSFYHDIKSFAEHRGFFLYLLLPDRTIENLLSHTASLDEEWYRLSRHVEQEAQSRARTTLHKTCIEEVTKALNADVPLDNNVQLTEALKHCLEAGVPPSNLEIHKLLIEHGAGEEHLTEFPLLRASFQKAPLTKERAGRKSVKTPFVKEVEDENEIIDAETEAYRKALLPYVKGLRIAILGGVARQRTCAQLKSLLDLSDCVWLPVEKGKNALRHRTEIEKSDFIFLLKNLASHEMIIKAREWAKDTGKQTVFVPAGNGVKQLVHQLHCFLHAEA